MGIFLCSGRNVIVFYSDVSKHTTRVFLTRNTNYFNEYRIRTSFHSAPPCVPLPPPLRFNSNQSKIHTQIMRMLDWENVLPFYVANFKLIPPSSHPRIPASNISRQVVSLYSRLILGHNLLPNPTFKLGFNTSPPHATPHCTD